MPARFDYRTILYAALASLATFGTGPSPAAEKAEPQAVVEPIKAYCLDFNWAPTGRRRRPFAKPGTWAGADPAKHVAWYKALGANVIQTFCVSTDGYAWYKDGFVPAQPGLKHDFLTEMVQLGHAEGMRVFGYFCIASNPKWGTDHPDQSYGTPTTYHIPYTDEYLAYLTKSIQDAVHKTGIDGFMVDWLWMPNRAATEGKWLDCEKALYAQLMGEPFPGEDKLSGGQENAYSRKAIDRCWKAIREAAKEADPDCIVWVTVNNMNHPHVVNSDMYKEADWLMNEKGDMASIRRAMGVVGEHTRLITCMAAWNGADAVETVPEAVAAGVGLYGFTTPRGSDGLVPLKPIFSRQLSEITGDQRNIAVLARLYHGASVDSVWQGGQFVEPDPPPPLRVSIAGRGRGFQDTASLSYAPDTARITVSGAYGRGRGSLKRLGDAWPAELTIRLQRKEGQTSSAQYVRMTAGGVGFGVSLSAPKHGFYGAVAETPGLKGRLTDAFPEEAEQQSESPIPVVVKRTDAFIEVSVPAEMTDRNPPTLNFEWDRR